MFFASIARTSYLVITCCCSLVSRNKKPELSTPPSRSRRSLRDRISCICQTAMLVSCIGIYAAAQTPVPAEYGVEATDLVNFGRFLRHSDVQPPHASFDLCILGRDPLGRRVDDLAAKEMIDNLPVRVLRSAEAAEVKACEIVFISAFEGNRIREDLATLAETEALTVSDARDFLDQGGMIQFVFPSHRVKFAINLIAVNRAHLILSSELLRVATTVAGKPTGQLP
jgi:YfiR/HmsC-like